MAGASIFGEVGDMVLKQPERVDTNRGKARKRKGDDIVMRPQLPKSKDVKLVPMVTLSVLEVKD